MICLKKAVAVFSLELVDRRTVTYGYPCVTSVPLVWVKALHAYNRAFELATMRLDTGTVRMFVTRVHPSTAVTRCSS
uniref:Secreted protein n=1 Tax=Schistosoma mansoni TaxID=6183 RepID=A0A5K4F6J6_SCHMA